MMPLNDVFTPKKPIEFSCDCCDFNTSNKKDYVRHISTSKHKKYTQMMTNDAENYPNPEIKMLNIFECDCGKQYKYRQGLFNHKKCCLSNKQNSLVSEQETEEEENKILNDEPKDKQFDLIMMLIKENSELKNMMIEQSKETSEFKNIMLEVIKNGTSNTNISNTTTTNSHNKAFNLQFFLNETCKNAMNITEFADSIKLQLSDFENVGDVGFITGISNIIIKNLKALDITQRPVHCTDQKREIIYIKDEDKWEKEDDKKQKFHKFLKKIINKNQRLLLKFQEIYPDYNKYSSPNSTRYDKIVIEALGGRGDNTAEKENKILSIISKTIGIDKI
jgi:hypothetical protein